MSDVIKNIEAVLTSIPDNVTLVAVSKTKPNNLILEAYNAGQLVFGENKVQDLVKKHEELPKDIKWHFIGHLQTNKVKQIAPFVDLIHAIDSFKLLKEINKQAIKNDRTINCLLQVKIASEESKFGLSFNAIKDLLQSEDFIELKNVNIVGLMGMASNTANRNQIQQEFKQLNKLFVELKIQHPIFTILSTGMSGDYQIAIKEGSTMIRVGSSIFGARNY